MGRWTGWAMVVAAVGASGVDGQSMAVEYIGHAAVVVESGEDRVLIDPYNGSRWMGYGFPRDLDVDAVLVTHPHYDHDAAYYAGNVPVFTEPGRYRVGSLELIGVDSEHIGAQRYRDGGMTPWNVIWTVVADGKRVVHFGDNRVPTEEDLDRLDADVILVPPFHSPADARRTAEALGASVVLPVHLGFDDMRAEGYRMPPVEAWLDGTEAVYDSDSRLEAHEIEAVAGVQFRVLRRHRGVRAWRADLAQAWRLHTEAGELRGSGESQAAVEKLAEAERLAPEVMSFPLAHAELLVELQRTDEAERILNAALARATEGDIEPTTRMRAALARLLAERGLTAQATVLYRAVLDAGRSYASDVQDEARRFLSGN